MTKLHWLTASEAAQAIAARKLSPLELTTALLDRIDRLDPKLNVFIRLDREAALHSAPICVTSSCRHSESLAASTV